MSTPPPGDSIRTLLRQASLRARKDRDRAEAAERRVAAAGFTGSRPDSARALHQEADLLDAVLDRGP